MLNKLLQEIKQLKEKAKFSDSCCDDSKDRMYRAKDKTWWKRVNNHWKRAESPQIINNQLF